MIFWDTSALVPLLVEEANTRLSKEVARRDGDVLVWWGTAVEILSAVAHREREGGLSTDDADDARDGLAALIGTWSEVLASDPVRNNASRLLRRHTLRAADALQLGAALAWADGSPEGRSFFTFDDRLAGAARREGFRTIAGTKPRQ